MILKTYTRILTTDLARTVETLKAVHGVQPHLTIPFESWTIVATGDVLVVGGTEEALASIRGSLGPWIVENLDDTKSTLIKLGATVVRDIVDVPTGRMMYMKHADGVVVEYVEWTQKLKDRYVFRPLNAGVPASQVE